MGSMQGRDSGDAIPRWMGLAAIALTVVVALIAVVGLVSLGRRIGTVEGRASSTARSFGDLESDLSARIDRLSDRVNSARTDIAVIKKLSARITRLSDDLAVHAGEDESKALAASLSRLESSLTSLKGEVLEAMRMASKAAETRAAPAEPAASSVSAGDLEKIADRIADVEERVEEIGKKPKTASTSSRTRINEEAVKKLVEGMVKEQVDAELKTMRERFRGRRPGGGEGGD